MSTRGDVVAVTCLALEARIALGPGVSVICTHASQLIAALDRALRALSVLASPADSRPISLRATGWSAPACGPTRNAFRPIAPGRARFSTRFRARCMPRSSGRMRLSRIPWKSAGFTCERAPSPSTTNRMSLRESRPLIGLRSVVRQPSQIPALARTALEARTAGAALRRGRRLLGVGLAFPYFRDVTLDSPVAVEAV